MPQSMVMAPIKCGWRPPTNAAGAKVFCIDIKNLAADLIDSSKLKVNVISVDFDR